MTRLTRKDIIDIAGERDDAQITAIIATGASPAELLEAVEWIASGGKVGLSEIHARSGNVGRLIELLQGLEEAGDER